jgi:hypothetical protein
LQASYLFENAGEVVPEAIGEPDANGIWFHLPRMWTILEKHFGDRGYQYLIGISNCRITHTQDEPETAEVRDYFSLSDLKSLAVIGVNDHSIKYKPRAKTAAQYAAFLVAHELAIMTAKLDLTHNGSMKCVFNDCADRTRLAESIDHGVISPTRVALMKERNVPVESLQKIFDWARKNSLSYRISFTALHPASIFAAGICLGSWAALYVSKETFKYLLLAAVLIIIAVFHSSRSRPAKNTINA